MENKFILTDKMKKWLTREIKKAEKLPNLIEINIAKNDIVGEFYGEFDDGSLDYPEDEVIKALADFGIKENNN